MAEKLGIAHYVLDYEDRFRRAVMDDFAQSYAKGETPIRTADRLLCESWNERMWADGEPIDPSPTVDQAVNGGYPWLEIECSLKARGKLKMSMHDGLQIA